MIHDIPHSDQFWEKMKVYLEEYWWPAIRRDPMQYNYWRMTAQKRMGKFKIVRSEGQEVLEE
jgi:hypothetical protein